MGNREILDHVHDSLPGEPVLADRAVIDEVKGERRVIRRPTGGRGTVEIRVEDGVVTLDGEVPLFTSKRLVGVLA